MMDTLLQKLSSVYSSKKQSRIESRGPRFELSDFVIKLGSVSLGQSFKGVLVEVEYLPCVIPNDCWDFMREFLQGFLGSCVQSAPPTYLQSRMQEIYTPTDTVFQYLEQFNNYKKTTGVR